MTEKRLSGLQRVCKTYGAIVVNGKRYVWDHKLDKAVPDDTKRAARSSSSLTSNPKGE